MVVLVIGGMLNGVPFTLPGSSGLRLMFSSGRGVVVVVVILWCGGLLVYLLYVVATFLAWGAVVVRVVGCVGSGGGRVSAGAVGSGGWMPFTRPGSRQVVGVG